jgi:hypothetical protein
MADAYGSGPYGETRGGSTPLVSTNDSNIWNLSILTNRPNFTFVLANEGAPAQTDDIMKNFPRTRIFAPIATGIIALFLIQACAQFSLTLEHGVFGLIIRRPVPIKGENQLAKALATLNRPGVKYHFHLVRDDNTFRDFDFDSGVAIKTDRVIMTELAQSLSKDGLTPIGSSLTHHGHFTSAADVATVLSQVKTTN